MKKIVIILLCAIIWAETSVEKPNYKTKDWIELNKSILQNMSKAENLFAEGLYKDSAETYDLILKNNENDEKILELSKKSKTAAELCRKIELNYQKSNYTECLNKIASLNNLSPKDMRYNPLKQDCQDILILQRLSQESFNKTQYNEAIEQANKISNINPEDTQAPILIEKARKIISLKKQAIQRFVNGEYAEAKQNYQNILKENPLDQTALKGQQNCAKALDLIIQADNSLNTSDFASALAKLEAVVEINPDDATAQRRSSEYQRIIAYYRNNTNLLRSGFYEELNFNYELMLNVLKNNPKLNNEKKRYQECAKLQNKFAQDFASENFVEALSDLQTIININPNDEIASINIPIIKYALGLEKKASDYYRAGVYAKSLEVYEQISKLKPFKNIDPRSGEWNFYRGQKNTFSLTGEYTSVSILFSEGRSASLSNIGSDLWQGTITTPAGELEGYHAAKAYLKLADKVKLVYLPYLVKDNKSIAPTGFSNTEKDLTL